MASLPLTDMDTFHFITLLQVAYVLGQLQDKEATSALTSCLKNIDEHPMVRHEAAEALGSIAGES